MSFTDVVSEFRVNTETSGDQSDPKVSALTGGGFVVTWESWYQDGDAYGVYAQRYDGDGVAQGAEFLVNTTTAATQDNPAISPLADGGFVITWRGYNSAFSEFDIYGQRYASDGSAVGSEFVINTDTGYDDADPSVTGLTGGGFLVTWETHGQDGSGDGVYGQMFAADGSAVGGQFLVNTETNNSQGDPAVAALVDGGAVVVWTSIGQDGSSDGIYGQRFASDGSAVSGEFLVNTTTDSTQYKAEVVGLADGGFVVTWTSFDTSGSLYDIYVQRYASDGSAVGSETLVNTTSESHQVFSQITALADGGFVVTWTDYSGADGDATGVFAQRFASDGTAAGSEAQVNTYTTAWQDLPDVAALDDGSLVFTWESYGQDGDGEGIYSKIVIYNTAPTGSVTITGTATQGETLTASDTLADADGLGTITYQWQRDGVDIAGATGSTYDLVQADVGAEITVVASYTDGRGTAESATSAATTAVANANDLPTGVVLIDGTTTQGQTLSADTFALADADGLGTFSYQWQRDGVDIVGATGSTYDLVQADVGTGVRVVVSYTDALGAAETVTSGTTAAIANVNDPLTGGVSVSGTATQGETLTASNTLADADGLGVITYQWQRDGVDIVGATGATYDLVQADVGAEITVVASYTDGEGTAESATSAATTAVANANDLPTGAVAITGTTTEGETLSVDTSALADADGLGAFSYQWQRDGVDIAGATGTSYDLVQADVGGEITVVVSYTDALGAAETVTSGGTAAIANVNDLPSGGVSVSGTATQGETLAASNTLADADGLGAITYQWQRDGVDIAGATGASYDLLQADVGAEITVVASYTDGEGTAESATSAATAAVANVNDLPSGGVSVSGTATQGETLTASNTLADADGLGAITYQWQRDGVDIAGATGTSYDLVQADVGAEITVVASYTDGEGTAEMVTSGATALVQNANDAPTGLPAITGTASEGQQLSADLSGVADADGLGTFECQWMRDGVAIEGATGANYLLAEADATHQISVVVTYVDGHGTSETLTSQPTAAVTPLPDPVDRLVGTDDADVLTGSAAKDAILGLRGDDLLLGSFGDDLLRGGRGKDQLLGGYGEDTLMGGTGNDRLRGYADDDTLKGGKGSDRLTGGKGNDDLTGGEDADVFVFGRNAGSDRVWDFEDGLDVIRIRGGVAVEDLTIVDDGDDMVISFEQSEITLKGLNIADVTLQDVFDFA